MEITNYKKWKSFIKTDGLYLIFGITLILILLFISTTFKTETSDYTLQLPGTSLFGTVAWIAIIILGIIGLLIFRKIDRKNIKLENVFLILIIPLSLLYCIVTPLGRVPDEDFHIRKAMAIAQGNFFSTVDENGEATDYFNAKLEKLVTTYANTYSEAYNRMTLPETDETIELSYTTLALYTPLCHMPQALGIFITKLFNAPIVVQCYAARLTNLAVSIFLIYEAIKLIPIKKHFVLLISLLPITLQELASLSSDALTISISIFYISYILYLKYDNNKKEIEKKEIVILAISSLIVSLCKIVYLPLCLLLFILPKEKFKTSKQKIFVQFPYSQFLQLLI